MARLTVAFSSTMKRFIIAFTKKRGHSSEAETIRDAIAILIFVDQKRSEGKKFWFVDEEGEWTEVDFGF